MKRIIACLIATVFAGGMQPSFGQNYPTKSVRIIIPFAPGGGTDFIARVAAQKMSDRLAADGVSAAGGTPEEFLALIKRDIETWRRVVQKAGIKVE